MSRFISEDVLIIWLSSLPWFVSMLVQTKAGTAADTDRQLTTQVLPGKPWTLALVLIRVVEFLRAICIQVTRARTTDILFSWYLFHLCTTVKIGHFRQISWGELPLQRWRRASGRSSSRATLPHPILKRANRSFTNFVVNKARTPGKSFSQLNEVLGGDPSSQW